PGPPESPQAGTGRREPETSSSGWSWSSDRAGPPAPRSQAERRAAPGSGCPCAGCGGAYLKKAFRGGAAVHPAAPFPFAEGETKQPLLLIGQGRRETVQNAPRNP